MASNQINLSLAYRKQSFDTLTKCSELGVRVLGYFPLANGNTNTKANPVNKSSNKVTRPAVLWQDTMQHVVLTLTLTPTLVIRSPGGSLR